MPIFKRRKVDFKKLKDVEVKFDDVHAPVSKKEQKLNQKFMLRAFELAEQGMNVGEAPFGCVIVKQGKIVGEAHREVSEQGVCTAHEVIVAIERASKSLGTRKLYMCDVYLTNAPCPMCFGALYLAKVKHIYYGGFPIDVDEVGFPDLKIFEVLAGRPNSIEIPVTNIMREHNSELLQKFVAKRDEYLKSQAEGKEIDE